MLTYSLNQQKLSVFLAIIKPQTPCKLIEIIESNRISAIIITRSTLSGSLQNWESTAEEICAHKHIEIIDV